MPSFLTRHKEFLSNVAIIMSGKSLAALIALLTMPIVARLFSPEHFGVAAVFLSIIGVVASVATLRYGAAIVLPKDESEAIDIMALAFRISFGICLVVYILLGLYSVAGVSWSLLELLGSWLWFLPVGIFLLNSVYINDAWLTRKKSFKRMSAAIVTGNSATGAFRIGFGAVFGSTVPGLIFGHLLGLLLKLRVQQAHVAAGFRKALQGFDFENMRAVAQRYSDFPKHSAPAGLISSFGHHLPVLMFGMMFTPTIAGMYAMADRLSKVPVTVVAQSIQRVFMQKSAGIQQDGRSLRKAFVLTVGGLAGLGLVPFGLVWLFGQEVAVFVLGDDWSGAGAFLEIMSPWLFIVWVSSPCNSIFFVLRRLKLWLKLQTGLTVMQAAVFALAYATTATPEWTLQAFVIATVSVNIVTIVASLLLIIQYDRESDLQHTAESSQ